MDVIGVDIKRISHSEDFSAANSVTMLSRTELPAHKSAQDEMLEISGTKVKEELVTVNKPCCDPPVSKKPKTATNGIKVKTIRRFCAHCESKINTKYVLKALDRFWHEDCLKCSSCGRQLAELSSTFYYRESLLLCREDYIRIYGATGMCSCCNKPIPPLELVMRARSHVFHLECFACQMCHQRFCIGDRFYLYHNMIMCEDDYQAFMMQCPPFSTHSIQTG